MKYPCYLASAKFLLTREASILVRQGTKAEPWFVLNNSTGRWCLDVAGSKTDDQTPVLAWMWNYGDNQIWRLQPVGS